MLHPAVPIPTDVLQLHNNEFIREAWRLGLRPDQREAAQVRVLTIELTRGHLVKRIFASAGEESRKGSSETVVHDTGLDVSCLASRQNSTRVQVKLGVTHVTASIHCHLVEPLPTKPKHGLLDIHVQYMSNERSGGSSAGIGGGGELTANPNLFPSSSVQLQRFLLSLFRGGVVDTEGLCVVPGKHVWSLSIHCCVWNNDGNVVDACHLAVLSLLLAHRRPEAVIQSRSASEGGEAVQLLEEWERDPVPLSLLHTPLACSFILTHDPFSVSSSSSAIPATGPAASMEVSAERLLADPTIEECAAAATSVTIVVNRERQVCGVFKGGGCFLSLSHVLECIRMSTTASPTTEEGGTPVNSRMVSEASEDRRNVVDVQKEKVRVELGGIAAYWWSVIDAAVEKLEVERKEARRASFHWAKSRTGVAKSTSFPSDDAPGSPDIHVSSPKHSERTIADDGAEGSGHRKNMEEGTSVSKAEGDSRKRERSE